MSRWLTNEILKFSCRNRTFNSIVGVTPLCVDRMAESFDTIFSNITSYKDEISSLTLYPFYIKYTDDTPVGSSSNVRTVLRTSKGKQVDIPAINIDNKACLRNIGYVKVPHINYNFLDYNGYTKYCLYLPFFSMVDLDASVFVDNYVVIRLAIDYFTGQGMYILSKSKNEPKYVADNMYYTEGEEENELFISNYIFNLGIEIPIGSSNIGDIKRNVALGVAKSAINLTASAYGLSLPPNTTTTSYEESSIVSSRGDYKGARMIPRKSLEKTGTKITTHNTPKNVIKPISETVSTGISILNNNFIQGHGDRTNNPMSMWTYSKNPCLYVYIPNVDSVDNNYKHLKGLPLGMTLKLKQVSGFTTITNIHLEGFDTATEAELNLIESTLTSGIILPENETIQFTINGLSFVTSKGFTWEQFVRTQSSNIRMYGSRGNLVEYLHEGVWKFLGVYGDELIKDGFEYTT